MPTISETGYAKLIANLRTLIAAALQLLGRYNPSKPAIMIESMQNLAVLCDSAMLNVSNAKAAYKTALDERDKDFSLLNKLTTRVINALKASDSTERIDQDARSIVKKIQGVRSKMKSNESDNSEDTIKENSISQMSYDNRINNFQDLIQLLKGIVSYKPNETELQPESLDKYKNDLIKKNAAVVSAYLALQTARAARNELLFKAGTGLVDIAQDAKAYMKSVFGSTSPEYKQVSKLEFKG
ncbi:MAG TPA: hypothetical protein VK207_07600 [Bacteroidales bacterium]|nr:hypothetical protein [Bacteroidales bacterium]